jgi:tartrate/fumarate subfamily iron-sulfur-dependent hydro-lyase beta chain
MKKLAYPFTASKIRQLKAGDKVDISGRVFTGRDRLHKYLYEGGRSPVELKDGAIYHCGPVVLRKEGNWHVCAAGPTTSVRQELYMPRIIEQNHVRMIIGKGGMGEATMKACVKHGCVYMQVVGGAASLLAQNIEKVEGVHFIKEFGDADAMWELLVKGFKAVVTMDAYGRNLHKKVRARSKRALNALRKKKLRS